MDSDIEVLVVGNCFLNNDGQDPAPKLDYKRAFDRDWARRGEPKRLETLGTS